MHGDVLEMILLASDWMRVMTQLCLLVSPSNKVEDLSQTNCNITNNRNGHTYWF